MRHGIWVLVLIVCLGATALAQEPLRPAFSAPAEDEGRALLFGTWWRSDGRPVAWADLPQIIKDYRAICVGESHPNAWHHRAQLEVFRAATESGPVAAGLEMLWRSQQPSLDKYLTGEIDETAFLAAVDWKTTWGFPWEIYAPIFRFARAEVAAGRKAAVFGINADRRLVREVGRKGVEGVSLADRLQLPELDFNVPGHRETFIENLGGAHGHDNDPSFERMYQAMLVWDEFMAESAARVLATSPDWRVVVLAGTGHIGGRVGIPRRLERRLGQRSLVILPVELRAGTTLPTAEEADLCVFTPAHDLPEKSAWGAKFAVDGALWHTAEPGAWRNFGLMTGDVVVQADGAAPGALAEGQAPNTLRVARAGRMLEIRRGDRFR